MPNYSLVVNSQFQPFSLERYLKPFEIYGEAYQLQQDALHELDTEATYWENKANSQTDPHAYAQAKRYADALHSEADYLAQNGLTPNSRQRVMNLRSRYAGEVLPIKEAYTNRMKLAEEQRQAKLKDSSLRFDKDYSTESLDSLLGVENPKYDALSGNEVVKSTVEMAAPLAKVLLRDPAYKDVLGGQYFQQRLQLGYTIEEILAEALGDPQAPMELRNIRNTIKEHYKENGAYDEKWIDQYINKGMMAALGQADAKLVANGEYVSSKDRQALAQGWARIDLAERQFEFEKNYKIAALQASMLGKNSSGGGGGNGNTGWSGFPAISTGTASDASVPKREQVVRGSNGELLTEEITKQNEHLAKLNRQLEEAAITAQKDEEGNPIEEITIHPGAGVGYSPIKSTTKYGKIKQQIKEVEESIQKERDRLELLAVEYDGISGIYNSEGPDAKLANINLALQLEKNISREEGTDVTFTAKNTEYKEVNSSINRILSITKEDYERAKKHYEKNGSVGVPGVVVVNENGKVLSYKDLVGDKEGKNGFIVDDNKTIKVHYGKGGTYFKIIAKGSDNEVHEYRIYGIKQLDDMTKYINDIHDKLTDFKNVGALTINERAMERAFNANAMKEWIDNGNAVHVGDGQYVMQAHVVGEHGVRLLFNIIFDTKDGTHMEIPVSDIIQNGKEKTNAVMEKLINEAIVRFVTKIRGN